ncbi:MAG TPA: hypothetical protein VH370_16840 [Humisphaera sp.]|nr:hypothetical protein [Humisphaera sp.]
MNHFTGQGSFGDAENFPNYAVVVICILIVASFILAVVGLVIRDRLRLRKKRIEERHGFPLD